MKPRDVESALEVVAGACARRDLGLHLMATPLLRGTVWVAAARNATGHTVASSGVVSYPALALDELVDALEAM